MAKGYRPRRSRSEPGPTGRTTSVTGAMLMKNANRSEYMTRHAVLKLLSDEEVARVSTVEGGIRLSEGDEYLDLEQLGQGVRRADATGTPMRRVLPRKAL